MSAAGGRDGMLLLDIGIECTAHIFLKFSEYTEKEKENETKPKRAKRRQIKKKKKKNGDIQSKPEHPQEFRDRIRAMGATENPILLIQKKLYQTDLSKQHNRFSMPFSQVTSASGFLTPQEIKALQDNLDDKSNKKHDIEVRFLDPALVESKQKFTQWRLNNTGIYILRTNWYKEVVTKNPDTLQQGPLVQVWSFRVQSQLCLALVALPT